MLFIETRRCSSLLERYLSDEEYRELQQYLLKRPDAGALIPGSSGIRKLRWAAGGKGKSGGVRVIYYWAKSRAQIYLLTVYSKGERADLGKAALKRITKNLEELK